MAKSFARIHRQNLIAQGIVPLLFAAEDAHDGVALGDEWLIEDLRAGLAAGAASVDCCTGARSIIELRIELLRRERDILLAGGMLGYLRPASTN
ncbi:hypothetical protein BH20ACT23_BH20ACT23_03910 [soil metagenome]